MTYEQYLDSLGVELNQPFQISFDGRGGAVSSRQYKFTKCGLENYGPTEGEMDMGTLDRFFKRLILGQYSIIKPFPSKGDIVYYPDLTSEEGVYRTKWMNFEIDKRIRNRVGVYPDYESAKERAKELGWFEESIL